MNRSIYFAFIAIGNNIVYNYYLLCYMFFPKYFKQSIVNQKKHNDIIYNKMMLLSFTDDIYNTFNIDLIQLYKKIINSINTTTQVVIEDDISIMSDMSDVSSLNELEQDNINNTDISDIINNNVNENIDIINIEYNITLTENKNK